jgi:hypothetical protein
MKKEDFAKAIEKFLPENTSEMVTDLIFQYKIDLTITRDRKTKLGDFKVNPRTGQSKISINGGLNPWSFLITLLHELAHAWVYADYKHRLRPHGNEWKNRYIKLMIPFFEKQIFPEDIALPLSVYMRKPKASSSADPELVKALRKYDNKGEVQLTVSDLEPGSIFHLDGKKFRLEHKRRTRYLCTNLQNKRQYLISGIAIIEAV